MKILITGGNSSIALKLSKAFEQHEVVLADYGEVPSFSSSIYKLVSLGEKNEDTLAHTLLNNCLNEGVDAILPLYEFELMAIAKTKILFNEFNIQVLLPEITDLNQFLPTTNSKESWVILNSGKLVFATANVDPTVINEYDDLNGAFYVTNGSNLSLITIS